MRLYADAVLDTDRDRALQIVTEAVEAQVSPEEVVFEIVLPSLESMMTAVSEGQGVSLAQHYMAAQIGAEVVEEMIPRFTARPATVGRVIIGTAPGDFHGLGKRIVTGCLKAMMVDVVDLGLNIPAERFVDEAVAREAQVIAVSTMMLHTALGEGGSRGVRRILRERGLEGRIRIAVGGAPYRFDPKLYRAVEADAWAENGILAGKVITDLIHEARPL
jgi:methanogenic corrinoid protein MtbC1